MRADCTDPAPVSDRRDWKTHLPSEARTTEPKPPETLCGLPTDGRAIASGVSVDVDERCHIVVVAWDSQGKVCPRSCQGCMRRWLQAHLEQAVPGLIGHRNWAGV